MPTITTWIKDFDIVIQAGHENTPDNKTGGESQWGREIVWTPIVANEASTKNTSRFPTRG
jgi:hypothetical protein